MQRLLPALKRAPPPIEFPFVECGHEIPKIIHQTAKSRDLDPYFQENIDRLRADNPGWDYRFYDDEDIRAFISREYGLPVLAYYDRIAPGYGAAKADLFRYLLLYKCGGVYLDIKSSFTKPIDEVVQSGDRFLLAGWQNRAGEPHAGWGLYWRLRTIEGGEFQQWHIICAPGHPFLRAVIGAVLANIDRYRPWFHGVGGRGVLGLTGPVAYTRAIQPLLSLHPHRRARTDSELGLCYSANSVTHHQFFPGHYLKRTDPVIVMHGFDKTLAGWYQRYRIFIDRLGYETFTARVSKKILTLKSAGKFRI